MKIHIKKLGKQILAAAMAGVLLISSMGVESVFAAQEDVNEEAILSPEKAEEETAEEIGVEESSAGVSENLGEETDVNEEIAECEVVEPNGEAVELRAGQTMSLPAVAMGPYFSAAITSNGDLYCWGYNGDGQVGNGTTTNQSTPVKVLEQVSSVFISRFRTMAAIMSNGDLYCWGNNKYGQVGNGTTKNQSTPVKVLEQVSSVSSYGSSYTFGYGMMAAIKSNGDLYCWGSNDHGQVGNGTTTNQNTPVKILEQVSSISVPLSSTGYGTIAALQKNGDLYCWGYNSYGEVVNGMVEYQSRPVKVLEQVSSVSVYGSAGTFGTIAALQSNGDLYCWGDNYDGSVGDGTWQYRSRPVKVLEEVSFVSGTILGTIAALQKNGDLYCWGDNSYGEIGDGTTIRRGRPVKVLEQVSSVSVYGEMMAAIKSNGDLYCWGYNNCGQVGNGTRTNNQSSPVKVLDQVSSVSGSGSNYVTMAAVKSNGDLYCWGYNSDG